jgi:tRNA (guanine-N(7)-)-methyltransferase subunit TRM82
MMRPFQKAVCCDAQTSGQPRIILLASGPTVFSFHGDSGEFLSEWTVGDNPNHEVNQVEDYDQSETAKQPSAKKRKLSSQEIVGSDASSAEIFIENGKNEKPRKKKELELPSVTNLLASKDGRHVIATTGEDKSLRVLELSKDGRLTTLNER